VSILQGVEHYRHVRALRLPHLLLPGLQPQLGCANRPTAAAAFV